MQQRCFQCLWTFSDVVSGYKFYHFWESYCQVRGKVLTLVECLIYDFCQISKVETKQSPRDLQLKRQTDIKRWGCLSRKFSRMQSIGVWCTSFQVLLMNSTNFETDNKMMSVVMIWLSCVLSSLCMVCFVFLRWVWAVMWPMVRRNSYHRWAPVGF